MPRAAVVAFVFMPHPTVLAWEISHHKLTRKMQYNVEIVPNNFNFSVLLHHFLGRCFFVAHNAHPVRWLMAAVWVIAVSTEAHAQAQTG